MFKKVEGGVVFSILISILLLDYQIANADGLSEKEQIPTARFFGAPLPPLVEDEIHISPPPAPTQFFVEEEEVPEPDFWSMISNGLILPDLKPEGEIIASVDSKMMLGQGDIVYMTSYGKPFQENQEWVVYQTINDIHHPKTGKLLGQLINVLGVTQVVDDREGVATARITRSREPINTNDQVASMEKFLDLSPLSIIPPQEGSEGTIVGVQNNRVNSAQHDIVYIDYGRQQGVFSGEQFTVIHEGERQQLGKTSGKADLPMRNIGTIVILLAQEETSTAKIIQSVESISKGDTILYRSQN
ncbi:MAG: hypothetical protein ACE5FY_05990 [Nitrospiria bacterium]